MVYTEKNYILYDKDKLMKKIVSSLIILFIALQFGTIQTFAESGFYHDPERIYFPNGNMAYFEAVDETLEKIDLSGYTSGVYNNENPRKLIYKIDYNFSNLFNRISYIFSSDGFCYIRFWSHPYYEDSVVIEVFKDGVLIKEYVLSDFIADADALEYTTAGVEKWEVSRFIDDVNNVLFIETIENRHFGIDMYTGDVLYEFRKSPFTEVEIGDTVIITDSFYYNQSNDPTKIQLIPRWVKCIPHTVSNIEEDRILLGAENGINSWVDKDGAIPYYKAR